MQPPVSVEEVILALPNPRYRQVVADLRNQLSDSQRLTRDLESELGTLRNKVATLETRLAENAVTPIAVPAPVKSLEDLLAALRQEHQQKVEAIRRTAAEEVRTADDQQFDADTIVAQHLARVIRPISKNFEYVDLQALRDSILSGGYTPVGPIHAPMIKEFVSHIDSIRQCTRDGRVAHTYRDPTRVDVMRRMFDMCKIVEGRLIDTPSHLTLPPQAVTVDFSGLSKDDIMTRRTHEFSTHLAVIEKCGEVFEAATRDVATLDEQYAQTAYLPSLATEFELVVNQAQNEVEALVQNEASIRDISGVLQEQQRTTRDSLLESSENSLAELTEKQRHCETLFERIRLMLLEVQQTYDLAVELMQSSKRKQVDAAKCDYRIKQITKAIESELLIQQKYLEGTRFTTFLASKAKDLYKRLYNHMEDSMRTRRELCERTKVSAQEQLYSMAENLHDVVTKRLSADNVAMRTDQQAMDNANRSLMGLVHVPNEMEKQMEVIRKLTIAIASAKHRMNQSQTDITTIKQILAKYGTLQFLKRDSNFLSLFDGIEKQAKLKERLDEVAQKIKFVAEILVEIADPETRQDYVVQQALEALKQTVADLHDLLPSKAKIEDLDEAFRVNTSTRLKRQKRLLSHFLEELHDGTNDLSTKEPSIEVHTLAMVDNMQVVLAALTHNDEPVPQHLRSAYLQNAALGGAAPQQNYYDPVTGTSSNATAGKEGSAAVAAPGGGRTLSSMDGAGPSNAFEEVSEQPNHTFARFSERLKVSNESHKITKIPGGMEMSNTSALGAIGFRLSSGVHSYSIRIGPNCSRLLVGFADWNLPLDGYCNSIKYQGCYYLHVGNGTLWAPDQKIERKPYTYESIGTSLNGVLRCVVNTNDRSIGFVWNDTNLGIAFRNVNLTRTLYPAFELFSNNCSFEFVVAKR